MIYIWIYKYNDNRSEVVDTILIKYHKKILTIFLLFALLFLTIGCISASDNVTDANSTEQYNANNISTANNTVNNESDAHLSNSSNSSSNLIIIH